jgi:hypothetical protein
MLMASFHSLEERLLTTMSENQNQEKSLAPAQYIPGGLNKDLVKPVTNPSQTEQNHPFAAGLKIHEVKDYQNFFTFPLDTAYNVVEAITYFSDPANRNRYTYEAQQLIISRIMRAAIDFDVPVDGVRDKFLN